MGSDDVDDVQRFMTGYGRALATGDLAGIAACYAFPALVVQSEGTLHAADAEVIHDTHRDSAGRHRGQGPVAAVPRVKRVEEAGAALVRADVYWSFRDEDAAWRDTARYRYVLRRVPDGFAICFVAPAGG